MLLSKIQKTVIAAHAVKSQQSAEYSLKSNVNTANSSTTDSGVPLTMTSHLMTHQNTEDMDIQIDRNHLQDDATKTHSLNTPSIQSPPVPPLPLSISSESPTDITEENTNSNNLTLNLYGPHTNPGVSPLTVDADRALGMFSISGKYRQEGRTCHLIFIRHQSPSAFFILFLSSHHDQFCRAIFKSFFISNFLPRISSNFPLSYFFLCYHMVPPLTRSVPSHPSPSPCPPRADCCVSTGGCSSRMGSIASKERLEK